ASGRPFKRATPADRSDLPLVTGLERTAFRSDPEGTARRVVGALDVYAQWHTTDRLPIREIRFDPQGGVSLIAREPVLAIELSIPWQAGRDDVDLRLRTFDAVWNELSTDERNRVRTIHLGNRPDHVTVAFKEN
nr:hypothetical protein [Deltaproteobacteria bacterium]